MRPRSEQPVVQLILWELANGPATAYDLCDVVGIQVRNMRPYLRLLVEQGVIKISGSEVREHTPGPNPPIYALVNKRFAFDQKQKWKSQ